MRKSDEPAKWLKYEQLVKFGLVTREDLVSQIARYPSHQAAQLLSDLASELRRKSNEVSDLYVVKLVPRWQPGQLPNFRIRSLADLEAASSSILRQSSTYQEVWYCRTKMDSESLSVAGRIAFGEGGDRAQVIEQVWNCSPRLIEDYNDSFPYPYVRACRPSWGWRFRFEQRWPAYLVLKKLVDDFRFSILLLERRKAAIQEFCDYLEAFDLGCYSLEYKISGGELTVIDWDTPSDWVVLADG